MYHYELGCYSLQNFITKFSDPLQNIVMSHNNPLLIRASLGQVSNAQYVSSQTWLLLTTKFHYKV